MRHLTLRSFVVGSMAIALGFSDEAWAQDAPGRPYLYVSLDQAIPEGFDSFEPVSITDSRRIYGTLSACDVDACSFSVAVYRRGEIIALQEGFAATGNNQGTVGGGVDLDPALGTVQAALFRGSAVQLIPPLTDEVFGFVVQLTESNIALVDSFSDAALSQYLTRRGNVTPVDLGPDVSFELDINDRGRIAGTLYQEDGDRAFRYNPFSGRLTLLDPLPTEPDSWGQAINRRGDVLGYSFVSAGLERIGVWRGTEFQTYFVEGTPDFPTISNHLLWNERGLIVITDASRGGSYLVPRPGVRLNLADLTEGPLPFWTDIIDINERGDMIGVGGERKPERTTYFLLRRVGPLEGNSGGADSVGASSPQPASAVAGSRVRHPPALERILHQPLYGGLGKGRNAKSAGPRRG